jgi:hypothetical protein
MKYREKAFLTLTDTLEITSPRGSGFGFLLVLLSKTVIFNFSIEFCWNQSK